MSENKKDTKNRLIKLLSVYILLSLAIGVFTNRFLLRKAQIPIQAPVEEAAAALRLEGLPKQIAPRESFTAELFVWASPSRMIDALDGVISFDSQRLEVNNFNLSPEAAGHFEAIVNKVEPSGLIVYSLVIKNLEQPLGERLKLGEISFKSKENASGAAEIKFDPRTVVSSRGKNAAGGLESYRIAIVRPVPFPSATFSLESVTPVQISGIIPVKIFVNSPEEEINTVHLEMNYPPENLSLEDVSFSGSVMPNAAEKDIGSPGVIKLTSYTTNSYKGTGGLVVTLNFKAENPGKANINILEDSKIHLADGLGTDIFDYQNSQNSLSLSVGLAGSLSFKVKFNGIDARPNDDSNQKTQVTVFESGNSSNNFETSIYLVINDNGIYRGSFDLPVKLQDLKIDLRIKGPKHLARRFNEIEDLSSELDLTYRAFEPGDLPEPGIGQDGYVNLHDIDILTANFENPAVADLNLDGVVNAADLNLIRNTLSNRPDE